MSPHGGLDHPLRRVQAWAPRLLAAASRPEAEIIAEARRWAGRLLVVPKLLAALVWLAGAPAPWLTVTLVAGLLVFGAVFAVNSALHSYLILHFSMAARVTMDVGFYYMANAAVPQRDLVVMDRPD